VPISGVKRKPELLNYFEASIILGISRRLTHPGSKIQRIQAFCAL